jgi:tripartite-type tricarboxylate transporter receptor subunit TctC
MGRSGHGDALPNACGRATLALPPSNTPPAIIGRLNAAINEGMSAPKLRATAAKLGIDIKLGTPADAATAASDCPRWIASAKLAGIKAE